MVHKSSRPANLVDDPNRRSDMGGHALTPAESVESTRLVGSEAPARRTRRSAPETSDPPNEKRPERVTSSLSERLLLRGYGLDPDDPEHDR